MITITVTVETAEQAQAIVDHLEDGAAEQLDFDFETHVDVEED